MMPIYGLRSYFGRVNYDYDGKYLVEVNGRYDGSSKFTGHKQYSFFPSFSAGWRLSKENFWQGLQKTVNDLKLRGSWGITGNQSVNLYSYYAALTASGYDFNGAAVQGYRQTTLANTESGLGVDNATGFGSGCLFSSGTPEPDGRLLPETDERYSAESGHSGNDWSDGSSAKCRFGREQRLGI